MERREYSEEEKREWRLDAEESFAELKIQAICFPTRVLYHTSTNLVIHPYPNPLSFGGMWGLGGAQDLAALKTGLREWRESLRPWEERGLTRIKIVREQPDFRAEPPPPEAVEQAVGLDRGKTKPHQPQQMSLL